ncbi:ketoacyl-ACP synthase III family protein [Streptomyces inhibens]|uniref:ketoacyl-ACP synthase III family protein n=1 Tax=Streptomyces inhibens TaxID=2293571 RepID=UPI001EE7231E|nr:ketoacyl-ACP synthase III family protein [Streptomyces inhibens]UKY51790.1 ketoacyl-ACP synthase III family protein [Streptomyces inhibens]
MQIQDVFVRSLGSWLPEAVSVQDAVDQGLYERSRLEFDYLTGTRVAGDVSAPAMTVAAARQALERAGQDSSELDSVIHSSVFQPGPEGWSLPGYTLLQLGSGRASVIELRQGCTGMLTAMELAVGQMTGAQKHENVLLTAADNFERFLNRWQCNGFIAGDAGSAALLSSSDGFARILSMNSRTIPELEAMHRGSEDLLSSAERKQVDLGARLGQFSESVMSTMDAAGLMSQAYVELAQLSAAEAGIEVGQCARVIYNNVAVFLVKQLVLDPLGLGFERSTWEFGRSMGHLGASDYVVSLEHLLATGAVVPGDRVLLLGGSPGYFVSSAVLEILDVPSWAGE